MKIFKKIKILVHLITNIFRIHNDQYVAYRWRDKSILGLLKLDKIKFIRRLRIKYWHKKASRYSPFSPFFRKDELSVAQQNNKLPLEVRDIYKTGSAILSNVLTESDISLINNFADNQTLKSDNNFIQIELSTHLNDIRSKLINKLEPILFHFFPKPSKKKNFPKIYVGMRIDYSFDGVDTSPQTANWHVDRFLPTINAIYFPNGSNWGEFEKDIGSPLITNKDLDYFVNDIRKKKKTPESIREDYYFNFEDRCKKKFTLEKNSMYIGTHHMQHRRSPIYTPGKRVAIFLDFYNFFSRKQFLSL